MKLKRWQIRVLVYGGIAAGLWLVITPRQTRLHGDGLSPEQREEIFSAYYRAYRLDEVKRPMTHAEYSDDSRPSKYLPMIRIFPSSKRVLVQVDRESVIQYEMIISDVGESGRSYAFKEIKAVPIQLDVRTPSNPQKNENTRRSEGRRHGTRFSRFG